MDFLRLLAAGRCGALDTFFSSLTYFGSEIAFMAAALLIFWCVDKRQGLLCLSGRCARYGLQPVFEAGLPHSAPMGARPGLSDRRSRPRGRDGLFLPPPAIRRTSSARRPRSLRAGRKHGCASLRRVDASGAVFADVPGRSHAAGRRRGLPDGAGAGCGALSGVPDGGCCEKRQCHGSCSVRQLCAADIWSMPRPSPGATGRRAAKTFPISRMASKTRTPCWARCWAF